MPASASPYHEPKALQSYAEIPRKKLVNALLAISFGTLLEWYDFTIYTQLASVISKVFFPPGNPAVQALSVWGIFAVGFISRPAGALIFGHLGDTKGRGLCLLLSVLLMGIPTVVIGCLPTYAQAGIAAPALLALMRLIQGLAMGGEFGAAMVYLGEIALPQYKAVTGSLGYVSLGLGVVIGILMVAAVVSWTPADALLVWGWRVPFLIAIVTLVAATMLRYHMPESSEFLQSHEELDEEYRKRLRQRSKRGDLSFPARSASEQDDITVNVQSSEDGGSMMKDPEAQAAAAKHYVPVMELFRNHWLGILVQTTYSAWVGAIFYLGYSWLPSFFVKHVGISSQNSLWMVLTGMVIYTAVVPVAGIISDKKIGPVTATVVASLISGATAVPTFLGFQTKSLAACWLLQIVVLIFAAYSMAILPAICSRIYPAGVRISGFNLGYNLGMMIFGGLTPLILTAIQTSTGSIFIGPGLWMTGMAGITLVSCIVLIKWFPQTNSLSQKN